MSEQNINTPKIGMKFNKHPSTLKENEYSLLVNGDVINDSGDFLILTNEQSNILCSRFKPGYKVIGILPVNTLNKTIFFLVNPITNDSEIGFIDNVYYEDKNDTQLDCPNCNHPLTPNTPELNIELCTYTTIINASCLNFNIDYPISATYEIGVNVNTSESNCNGLTIFFTDFLNPRRYLEVDNMPYIILSKDECGVPTYTQHLDCEAIKMVAQFQQPCISYVDVTLGGDNKAGVYQFALAYSTINGEPLVSYSTVTNPISLSSKQRTITVNTDYNSDKAIKLEINNIDTGFQYFNLVVLKTINQTTSAFIVGTFPVNSETFQYTYTGNNYASELPISIEEITSQKPIYEYAKGVAPANKHLFWYNLKEQRDINLQPVVSNIPLKWQTIETKEGFYANPTSANFVSFDRDEIYPFGLEFKKSNGYKFPTFLFVGKDKTYYQNTYGLDVDAKQTGDNVLSSNGCSPEILDKLWQVYNTAQANGLSNCYSNPTGNVTVEIPNTFTCYSESFAIPSGSVYIPVAPCHPSGQCDDPDAETYACCELLQVTPSGVVELPVFECTPLTIEDPFCDEKYNVTFLDYVPTNVNCVNADQYLMLVGNSCYLETYVCDTGENQKVTSTMPYAVFRVGVTPYGEDCDGNTLASNRNSVWFQFQAISKEQLIRFVTNNGLISYIKVWEGDCTGLTEIVNLDSTNNPSCSSFTHTASVNSTHCLTLNNLEEGKTYFVQISVQDTDGNTANKYGNICITAPQPESRYSYEQEAIFRWRCVYNGTPSFVTYPRDPTCFTTPYFYGDFAYWESTETYPPNPDVWGDLCGQNIRHFKFPDSTISHIHNNAGDNSQVGQTNRIYPIGVKIDVNDIKSALNQAVVLGLITEEEKKEITGYSIKRGNRRSNRSVLAKGLLYDVWRTYVLNGIGEIDNEETIKYQYYPNYPYNDLHDDIFLLEQYDAPNIKHPFSYSGYRNNRYTFHSPNTSFNKPELGSELKLETVEWGKIQGKASQVEKHAEYVLLQNKAYQVAKSLAALQINNEASSQAFGAGDSFGVLGTSGGAIINYIIYYAIGLATGFATNYTRYANDWLEIIKGLSTPINPTMYLTSIGTYNNFTPVPTDKPKRREIPNYRYLNSGNYNFVDNGELIDFNNFQRESSVFLSIKKPGVSAFNSPDSFTPGISDTSRQKNCEINGNIGGEALSYYASIKNYVPDQYGNVESIDWLDTGYCGVIDWNDNNQDNSCDTVFGGDTYINRFSLKRKMPFFLQDRVNFPEDTPVMYKNLSNVGFPRYFFNTLQDQSSLDKFSLPFLAPPNVQLDNDCEDNLPFYYRGKAYLYNYGVPSYICESDYNVDLRHGENDGDYKDFYPHVGDVVQWTQQYKNPISFDNTFYYNLDYSKQNRENFAYSLRNSFRDNLSICQATYPNRAIYSGQGVDSWFNYLSEDKYDFPLEDGKLIGVTGIEKDKVLVRQENSTKIFNAYITQESSLETMQISVGQMFATKPQEFHKTDLGFGGSNHTSIILTPHGQFYVDSQNPSIFNLSANGLRDLTRDKETNSKIQWFNEFLPFSILKDFPQIDVDNNYKYFGIVLNYDNKKDRILLTKRDAKLLPEYKNQVTYTNGNFYLGEQIIFPTDSTYFCNKSWTLAYNPLLQEWTSFMSYTPNYYTSSETYFQSGNNYAEDSSMLGVWTHNQTNQSFQTFYGKQHPFIVEYATTDKIVNKILQSVTHQCEWRRYTDDELNFSVDNTITFNKALIYNQFQSTGNLNLIPAQPNNMYQQIQYSEGITTATGRDILTKNVENFWQFNNFYNIAYNNGQPLMEYNCNPFKEINKKALNYTQTYVKDKMRNDYHIVRYTNDQHFLHQLLLKPFQTQTNNSPV